MEGSCQAGHSACVIQRADSYTLAQWCTLWLVKGQTKTNLCNRANKYIGANKEGNHH